MNRYTFYQRLGTALFIFGILGFILTRPAISAEELLSTLQVTGQGSQKIPTTLTQIELGVEITGKTAIEVQEQIAQRTSAVVDFLNSRNVEQLQTTGVQLQPTYDYSDNQSKLSGYIGTNTVSFRLPTDLVGDILDQTVQAGATRINQVSFTATDAAISAAQQESLRKATLDAQALANTVLKTLNLTPKEIVNIQINQASIPQPMFRQADLANKASAEASTPIIGGEQTIDASVTLQISY
ncbi:MAG: SIMPL domain-containing protein [Pleurocapsa sp.]